MLSEIHWIWFIIDLLLFIVWLVIDFLSMIQLFSIYLIYELIYELIYYK